eukprot:6587013-Pyramimonas_sp.AAC.1
MTTVIGFRQPARITNMSCWPLREGAPAQDLFAIHSQTRSPPDTSSRFKRQEPKSGGRYKFLMARSDYKHELLAP